MTSQQIARFGQAQPSQEKVYRSEAYGFSIAVPTGWYYESGSKLQPSLAVELVDGRNTISIPIFIEEADWEIVEATTYRNFKPELVEKTTLAGQPALRIAPRAQSGTPGYTYRIKHPTKPVALVGTAALLKGDDLTEFYSSVESVLNSIRFH